ncbi:MAG: phosphoribosyltransferase [Minisyncoccia bacterium]|jgi:hypoxanthine phosphoribosyltransferase
MKTVTYEEVTKGLDAILWEFGSSLGDVEFVVGVSRGGLFPAMVVATALVKPLVVAYIDKQDNVYLDRGVWVREKKVLLVDDIIRTGKTINKIKELLLGEGASFVTTLAPYYLKEAKDFAPDYGRMITQDISFPWDE